MKLKPTEIIILLLALCVGALAFFFQSTEQKANHKEETESHTSTLLEEPPADFFDHSPTVEEHTLQALKPSLAQQAVGNFFTLFTTLMKDKPTAENYTQIKTLLSTKTVLELSKEPETGTKELSRMVGLLTPPKETTIQRTEQLSPDHLEITVQITNQADQSTSKTITLINEDQSWKIDGFSE